MDSDLLDRRTRIDGLTIDYCATIDDGASRVCIASHGKSALWITRPQRLRALQQFFSAFIVRSPSSLVPKLDYHDIPSSRSRQLYPLLTVRFPDPGRFRNYSRRLRFLFLHRPTNRPDPLSSFLVYDSSATTVQRDFTSTTDVLPPCWWAFYDDKFRHFHEDNTTQYARG